MPTIRELGRGKYSDCFKVSDSERAVAVKVSYYQESTIRAYRQHAQHGDVDAARVAKGRDAISVSMAMAEVAKQMRLLRVSPHVVRVLCEADVPRLPQRLRALLGSRLPLLTAGQLKYSHVCIMELFSCTLASFARSDRASDATLRCLLFQVLYTLACLQKLLPGFRHNDLSTTNVLIRPSRHTCTRYTYAGTSYVTTSPYSAAIADFDFTHVPGHAVLSNERVLGGKYGISADPNPSYDVHLLLKTLGAALEPRHRAPETLGFIRSLRLDPAHDRIHAARASLVPAALLAHPFFAALKRGKGPCDAEYLMPAQ